MNGNGHPYQYIVLHQSVRNHPGVCAVQAAHAAGESLREPANEQTYVVALVAENAEELERLAAELAITDLKHAVIREPDAPYYGSVTAVGIEPILDREKVKSLVAGFKVLR